MIVYEYVWHGFCKFKYDCVTYTYKIKLKDGNDLYFTTLYSDFKDVYNLGNCFLDFWISSAGNRRSETSSDLCLFNTVVKINSI